MDLLFLFEWLDTSMLANFSKSYAGLFAVVQAIHILSMVMLVGMIFLGDMRMLNVLLKDVPSNVVVESTGKWIKIALVCIILSGIYESSAIAMKLYFNTFYWAKMAGLAMGLIYMYIFRNPLYRAQALAVAGGPEAEAVNPAVVKLVAVTSLVLWVTVAASGRWIGFS